MDCAFNIVVDELFYRLMDLLTVTGALGLIVFLARKRKSTRVITAVCFLGILLALGAGTLVAWSLQTWASTGRLLFPFITSASLLMALGIHALRLPKPLIITPMLVFSLLAPFVYIIPNYDHPPAVVQLPASAVSADVQWEDIRLTAYEIPQPREWAAGNEIPISLYWRTEAQSPLAYALVLSLADSHGQEITSFETWPGWGTFPHPWMTLDRDYRDDYLMQIPADAEAASDIYLDIRWYVFPDGPDLPALLESGQELLGFRLALGTLLGEGTAN